MKKRSHRYLLVLLIAVPAALFFSIRAAQRERAMRQLIAELKRCCEGTGTPDLKLIQQCIENGVDLSTLDDQGASLLRLACFETVITMLEDAGAKPDDEFDFWRSANKGNTKRVKELLAAGLDPRKKGPMNATILHVAAGGYGTNRKADPAMLQALIEAGADINAKDQFGFTPILGAIKNQDSKAVEFFLLHHANVYLRDYTGVPMSSAFETTFSHDARLKRLFYQEALRQESLAVKPRNKAPVAK